MPSISAAIIVKDEEKRLSECLSSLDGVVDEIVVVDTGSTDGTVAIAERMTGRCFHFTWADDFAKARNHALDQATGDFVLVIDADERVQNQEAAGALLRAFIARHDDQVLGTVEIIHAFHAGHEARELIGHPWRFFARSRYRYHGAVHEQLVPASSAEALQAPAVGAPTGVRFHHSGYVHTQDAAADKARRNIRLLRKELDKEPDDEYLHYQLGRAHYALDEFAEAASAFEVALRKIRFEPGAEPSGRRGPVGREVLTDLIVSLAYAYVNTGQTDLALERLQKHQALAHPGTERADFHHVLGYVHLMLGDLGKSRAAYQESLRLGPGAEDVRGTGSFSSAYHLGLLSEAGNDLADACAQYQRSLAWKPDYDVTLARCIALITETRIDLPREILEICDQELFSKLLLDALDTFLANGDTANAARLADAAAKLSPELHALCNRRIRP